MDIEKLEIRWIKLYSSNGYDIFAKETFNNLVDKYSEKHRYYHTLEHVITCLGYLDEQAEFITDLFNIEAAIWFHDVIYDPNRKNNEELSAEYAKSFLTSINIDSTNINKIEQLILLTQHPSCPETDDEKYLLDIDLSILGANEAHFDRYEQWIRQEYAFVPSFLYKRGREEVLNSFAKLDRIFHTDYFYDQYEIQARQNIDRALLCLQGS